VSNYKIRAKFAESHALQFSGEATAHLDKPFFTKIYRVALNPRTMRWWW